MFVSYNSEIFMLHPKKSDLIISIMTQLGYKFNFEQIIKAAYDNFDTLIESFKGINLVC